VIDSSQDLLINPVSLIKYAKIFAYELLGIYFPAASLVVYLLIFWGENFDVIENNVLLKDNMYAKLILFAIFTILIGEAINAISSRYTTISPVPTSSREKIDYLFKRKRTPLISKLRGSEWPTWPNETHYPISFETFDRDFLLRIDSKKKPIAGRLGWIAFYRNFFSVFILILSFNVIMLALISLHIVTAQTPSDSFLHLTLILSCILSIVFYFCYRAQNDANSLILWNSYRRNEVSKSLEAKYGDLTLALGVIDKFKEQSSDYITDTWFLALNSAMKGVSSVLYSEAEQAYTKFKLGRPISTAEISSFSDKMTLGIISGIPALFSKDIYKTIEKTLVRASSAWHDGEYETVINYSLRILEALKILTDRDLWKYIKGLYFFENEFYTEQALLEIQVNLNRWKWLYQSSDGNSDSANPSADSSQNPRIRLIHSSPTSINLGGSTIGHILESADPFSKTTSVILHVLQEFDKRRQQLSFGEQERCFKFIKCILANFGGFEFQAAIMKANSLLLELDSKRQLKHYYSINSSCDQHSFDKY
jgi:hypothetical protein